MFTVSLHIRCSSFSTKSMCALLVNAMCVMILPFSSSLPRTKAFSRAYVYTRKFVKLIDVVLKHFLDLFNYYMFNEIFTI